MPLQLQIRQREVRSWRIERIDRLKKVRVPKQSRMHSNTHTGPDPMPRQYPNPLDMFGHTTHCHLWLHINTLNTINTINTLNHEWTRDNSHVLTQDDFRHDWWSYWYAVWRILRSQYLWFQCLGHSKILGLYKSMPFTPLMIWCWELPYVWYL